MKRLKTLVLGLMAAATLSLAATPVLAFAAANTSPTPTQAACNAVTGNNSCTESSGSPTLTNIVKIIINVLSLIIGAAAVIMLIISGFKYITSGGDSNAIASAKNTLIYSIVGLIIVALAQLIVQFVLHNVAKS